MKKNRKLNLLLTIFAFSAIIFSSCGDNADDYSFSLDHKIPAYTIYNDSIEVNAGQSFDVKVDLSDEAGLSKISFSYSSWGISENFLLAEEGNPKSYTFSRTITVPADAQTEWEETVVRNDGSTYVKKEQYHKLILKATDVNLNEVTVLVRVKVKA